MTLAGSGSSETVRLVAALAIAGLALHVVDRLMGTAPQEAPAETAPLLDAPELVVPEQLQDVAAQLPHDRSRFVLAALQYAAQVADYQPVASEVDVTESGVVCAECKSIPETVATGEGNCLAKSVLLVALLRNRLGASEVYVAIGDVMQGDTPLGHAWVEAYMGGAWWVLEPAQSPGTAMPAERAHQYRPVLRFNDQVRAQGVDNARTLSVL